MLGCPRADREDADGAKDPAPGPRGIAAAQRRRGPTIGKRCCWVSRPKICTVVKDNGNGNPYGARRIFAGGSLHTLNAMRMLMPNRATCR